MTNEQIVEALATEVMGWARSDGEPFNCMVDVWVDDKQVYQYATELSMDNGGEILEPFDPLNDHNHMATIEAKMQQRGYKIRGRWDGCLWLWSYCGPPENPLTSEYGSIDKLMAEALAILQAVRK